MDAESAAACFPLQLSSALPVCAEAICFSAMPAREDACLLYKAPLEETQRLSHRFMSPRQLLLAGRFPVLTSSFSLFFIYSCSKAATSIVLIYSAGFY